VRNREWKEVRLQIRTREIEEQGQKALPQVAVHGGFEKRNGEGEGGGAGEKPLAKED
jgi:hypothetical protein